MNPTEFPEYIKEIIKEAKDVLYTGSKYICPTEPYADIDIMILVDNIEKWEAEHTFDSKCGDVSYPDDDMVAFRIDVFNILITSSLVLVLLLPLVLMLLLFLLVITLMI